MLEVDMKIGFIICRRPGGERIYGVFDNQLPAALRKLPFDRKLSMQNIRKVVSEADGYQPHLIAPEQGYRRLIEGSIDLFRGPAEAVVDAVCEHLNQSLGNQDDSLLGSKFSPLKYLVRPG